MDISVPTFPGMLNANQIRAVTHPDGPLLIVAGPGSGKTRVITQRILWLLHQRQVPPERILALTFTNHACDEMATRIADEIGTISQRLWIHTFHAVSLRILRRHGEKINLPSYFTVADEDEQRYWLQKAVAASGLNQERYSVRRLLDYISRRKAQMRRVDIAGENEDPVLAEAAQRYQDYLRQANLLDFDDLINQAVVLLQRHRDVRRSYNERLAYLLVDEYQDIDAAQYELLRLLTPPGKQISAVADPNQSIYGWRGANPGLIQRFQRDFRPTTITLEKSYRAPANLLKAAQFFINQGNGYPQQLQATHPAGTPIYHYILTHQSQEGALIGRLIHSLHEKGYAYRDIVILYRTHRLADALQQQLLQQNIPLQRIEPDSFFAREDVKEIIHYLEMYQTYREYDFLAALNYPHTLIDESTALQLQHIEQRENLTLPQLAARADQFSEISPLSRYRLRQFSTFIDTWRHDTANQNVVEQAQYLLRQIEQRRSPWTRAEETLLDGFQAAVQFPEALACLYQAIAKQQPINIIYPDSFDGRAAAFLLSAFLRRFWPIQVQSMLAGASASSLGAGCVLLLGAVQEPPQAQDVARLGPCAQESHPYPWTVCAWELAGDLLVRFEGQKEDAYTFYDLETTGTNVYKDEIIEIAAQRVEPGAPSPAPFFHHFVRPSQHSYIPGAASRVHHIYWADVANQPTVDKLLPAFLAYSRGTTLVGHNIQRFDNRLVNRELGRYLDARLDLPSIDTLPLARRLLPGEQRYRQEQLLRRLGLAKKQTHRADDDVHQVQALFYALLDRNLRQQARRATPDLLPLIGAVLLLDNSSPEDENEALLYGAARVWQRSNGQLPEVDHFLRTLPEAEQWNLIQKLSVLAQLPLPLDEETSAWEGLRSEFLDQVTAFVDRNQDADWRNFLDYQALRTSLDEADPNADRVTMMTLHNAKGSEYRVVFITSLEENHLPLWRQKGADGVEEERRLFYVGLTRAKERLYLISVKDRGDDFIRSPSPFVFQLPPALVKRYAIDKNGHWQPLPS